MTQYSYFPGCNLKTNAKGFEKSALAVSKKLGSELVEMPNWNCCGTVHTMTTNNLMKRIAAVRDLSRANKHIKDLHVTMREVVTLCAMCNSTLKIVNDEIRKDPEAFETINSFLKDDNESYDRIIEVKHYLEILRDRVGYEKISENVTKPLEGLKISPYYGCMLLHPEKAKIDDEEMPSVLEDLLESLGAEVIFSPYFKHCCGSYHIVNEEEMVDTQISKIVLGAKERGANAIVVACPLCAFNIDHQQKASFEKGDKQPLPVFYFTQLMAIAMGEPLEINHFEDHHVDPRGLLKKLGLEG